MATLSICEFDQLAITDNAVPPFGKLNPNTKYQTVAIGASSAASNAFASTTRFIRLAADSDCSVVYTPPGQSTISATISTMFIAANQRGEYFGADAGGIISAITNS
jgi:hypothetical protein